MRSCRVASASEAAFITNAVKEAKAHGLEFTGEEFRGFLDAERTAAESGELSELQLEGVAGGGPLEEAGYIQGELASLVEGPRDKNDYYKTPKRPSLFPSRNMPPRYK